MIALGYLAVTAGLLIGVGLLLIGGCMVATHYVGDLHY